MDMLFFGCIEDSGHYVWNINGSRIHPRSDSSLGVKFLYQHDTKLAPPHDRRQSKTAIHYFKTYDDLPLHATVIACWDYTVDDRPGSNAMFLFSGELSLNEMCDEASKWFPKVYQRLQPLILV